ncbi:MAG: hypothetical protein M0Z48_09555 [Nitrospiraceae bacterium]|nr:hypothetical protein [Nitrospiraceae bacterium]
MKKTAFIILIAGLIAAGLAVAGLVKSSMISNYETACCGTAKCGCSPFGGYCKGSRWGWYGAGRIVKTAGEAREAIRRFFLPEKISVARIQEKNTFFEAEVRGKDNKVVDTVIVDKRTGRISSIY